MRVDIGDGVRLFVDVVGSHLSADPDAMRERPVMLVLHGGPGPDHSVGRPYFDRFSDTHCVVYFDHRGNGRSDGRDDASGWDLDIWADDVARLCEALEIVSPVVLGNSFGGSVAMHAAGRHPALPSKLVLMSTLAGPDNDARLAAFERLGGQHAREVAQRLLALPNADTLAEFATVCAPLYTRKKPMTFAPGRMNTNLALILDYLTRVEPRMDLRNSLAAIRCPTLVLVGDDDPTTPPVMAERIVASLRPDLVRFERFDECGHGTYRDQPARTEAVLRDFLSRTAE